MAMAIFGHRLAICLNLMCMFLVLALMFIRRTMVPVGLALRFGKV